MYESIQKLTAAMSRGDERAVEQFYRAYFDSLFAQARRAGGRDEASCLDIVHDSILRIVRCIRPIDSDSRLRAWLKLVVQSCAMDRLRAEQRRSRRERAQSTSEIVAGANGALTEKIEWLRRQISRLDPPTARLFELRYEHGWTLARVAAAVGWPTGRVDGRLRRAIGRMRDQAMDEFDERD